MLVGLSPKLSPKFREHRTQPGTLDYNSGHIGIQRLGEIRCVWTAQNVEPKPTAGRPKLQDGGVALRAVTAAVVTNGTTYMIAPLALSVTKSSQV